MKALDGPARNLSRINRHWCRSALSVCLGGKTTLGNSDSYFIHNTAYHDEQTFTTRGCAVKNAKETSISDSLFSHNFDFVANQKVSVSSNVHFVYDVCKRIACSKTCLVFDLPVVVTVRCCLLVLSNTPPILCSKWNASVIQDYGTYGYHRCCHAVLPRHFTNPLPEYIVRLSHWIS